MNKNQIINILSEKNIKITTQRIAILEALIKMDTHPTVNEVVTKLKKKFPSISTGTVYKAIELFKEKGLVKKMATDSELMRYDAQLDKHHHLYSEDGVIKNYYDDELDSLLEDYFKKKEIENFEIKDININIVGNFVNK